jgi:hypothetical protein
MTTRTYTDKNGNEWSWDETPELIQLLKELHQSQSQEQQQSSST